MQRKTKTVSFGSIVRESHDSKKFYNSKLFSQFHIEKNVEFKEFKLDDDSLNKIYCKSSEKMNEAPMSVEDIEW